MSQYLLGIDNGNTVTKVSLFDLEGHELCVAARDAATLQPQPGYAERSMHTLWQNTAAAIREVVEKSGVPAEQIAGIGSTGHGNGLYLLNRSGEVYCNAIQSMDQRAAGLLQAWEAGGMREQMRSYTPQQPYPSQTAVLLAWLKQHDRACYDAIGTLLMCKDYINACLTGELVTDYSDMSAANLLNVAEQRYDSALLELLGIPEMQSALPRLAHSHDVIGCVTAQAAAATGLREGTPVVGGMIDLDASAVGTGVVQPGQGCILIGTWSINQVVLDAPIFNHDLFLVSPFSDGRSWLATEGSATSAANLEWFVKHFCGEERQEAAQRGVSVYDVCNELIESIAPEDSTVIFHPFLFGSNVLGGASAGFYGLSGWHTRAHLLRAVYEGVAFGHLSHIERLREAGAAFDAVRLSGGGARSRVWVQMFADLLGTPITVPEGFETGTRGAALLAGIGVGLYSSHADAVNRAVRLASTYEPAAERGRMYRERYQQYQRYLPAQGSSV
jgi:L-xylulokinase